LLSHILLLKMNTLLCVLILVLEQNAVLIVFYVYSGEIY
jgi:hypothetical protein